MSSVRRTTIVVLLAVLGIALAAAVTWATSRLVSQHIGLTSEPLTAGRRLLPRTTTSPPRTTPTRTSTRTATTTSTSPPAEAPRTSTAPPVESAQPPGETGQGGKQSSEGGDSGGRRADD